MLFFVLFALCFAQTTTTEYCYTPIKNGNEVVAYEKKEKGTAACAQGTTTTAPQLTGDYVCIDTGKLCGEGSDNKVTGTKCVMVNKCVVLGQDIMKFTLDGQKVKVTEFSQANCPGDDIAQESNNYDCGSCNDKGDIDDKYTCHKATEPPCTAENQATKCATHADGKKCIVDTANAQNNKCGCQAATDCAQGQQCEQNKCKAPSTTKTCYKEFKSGDKIVQYTQYLKEEGSCETGETETKPKIEGDFVCESKGNLCGQGADNKVIASACSVTEVCFKTNDGKSFKYEVNDKKFKKLEYTSADCSGTEKANENDCGKCDDKGEEDIKYECQSGAFETAILLVIAFIFFLF